MRFYNREEELAVLGKAVNQSGSAMIVISGRRRVGKSRLVDEFLKKNRGLKFIAVPKEEKQLAADFEEIFAEQFKPTFNSVRDALEYFFAKSPERILYIDEFPNFLEVNKSISFELQRLWEIYKEKTGKILILSGSYASMMDKIFTRQKAPLFNRASFKIILEPLEPKTVWEIQGGLGIKDPEQKITNYCVFGGIPYYYEVLEKYGAMQGIEKLFFGIGPLKEEGQDILRQEFGAKYRKYFSILEAIGAGMVSMGEIAGKMGITPTTLSKYIQSLQNDFKIIVRRVPFGQTPFRSKKGVYAIRDNLLAFWFSHVYGKEQMPGKADLSRFVGRRFEFLCIAFLMDWLGRKGERIVKSGSWWGSVEIEEGLFEQREIDLIVETDKNFYIGECKWSESKIGEKELARLKQSAKAVNAKKPVKLVLFSKKGFSMNERDDVLLFDAERIVKEN